MTAEGKAHALYVGWKVGALTMEEYLDFMEAEGLS